MKIFYIIEIEPKLLVDVDNILASVGIIHYACDGKVAQKDVIIRSD